jgi:hypothetical protein
MSKKLWIGLLAVVVLAFSVAPMALAQDDDGLTRAFDQDFGWIARFTDGRINAYDLAAPVAIYYTYETASGPNGGTIQVPNGLELLAIQPVTNTGELAANVSTEQLEQLVNGTVDVIDAGGFSLYYTSGWFWLTAPADAEGKVYNVSWENQFLVN